MDRSMKWFYEMTAQNIVEKLSERHFKAFYAKDAQQAKELALSLIPEGASVGLGGSVTLNQIGIIDDLRSGNYKLIDRYEPNLTWEQVNERYRQALLSDCFVTGTNAVTKNGELVNVDCSGNRVAAMIYGPRKVIVVVGANKVVENLDEAMIRLKRIAPINSKRITHKTPCTQTGKCENCMIPQRVCNVVGIINNGVKEEGRLNVIVVGDSLGY